MKTINLIIKFLSKLPNILLVVVLFVAIGLLVWGLRGKVETRRLQNTLHEQEKKYEDKLGRKVIQVTQLETRIKDFKKVAKKDSASLNDYEKKVLVLYKELENNKRKLRHVESALLFTSVTRDSFVIKLKEIEQKDGLDSIPLLPLKQGFFENKWSVQEFLYNPNNDSLFVDQIQETEFFVDMYKQRQLKENGKPHCFLWRWTLPWEYQASVKSLRDSTVITEAA
ncbi:MAG: hypothetical protein M0R03_23710, partial [Novosphingobium sp.]|nr:hypothetical protein [Novosphingobium sp.]